MAGTVRWGKDWLGVDGSGEVRLDKARQAGLGIAGHCMFRLGKADMAVRGVASLGVVWRGGDWPGRCGWAWHGEAFP